MILIDFQPYGSLVTCTLNSPCSYGFFGPIPNVHTIIICYENERVVKVVNHLKCGSDQLRLPLFNYLTSTHEPLSHAASQSRAIIDKQAIRSC